MNSQAETTAQVKLRRLWKGTLFVGIGGGYVLLVAMLFIYQGWRAALLALFLIGVAQFFRYIANDVDRIGWRMSNEWSDEPIAESTKRYQSRMLIALVGLAQATNLALIYQAYHLGDLRWMLPTLVGARAHRTPLYADSKREPAHRVRGGELWLQGPGSVKRRTGCCGSVEPSRARQEARPVEGARRRG